MILQELSDYLDLLNQVPPEDIMEPTLTPETHFCAEDDAECLERSIGMFVYYERIIAIMGGRSVDQRVAIVQKYQSMYKEDLSARFSFESKGCLIDCLVKLCYTPEEFDAIEIRRAMRGVDTDEDTIIEILCSRTNEHIRRIKQVYPKLFYGRDLQNDANNDTVHPFKRICIALLKADRDEFPFVNGNVVRSDAEELFTVVNQHGGMDESKLIPILTRRSYVHLRAVFNEYSTLGECNMEEDLKSNMHEPTLSCLLSIVCCIQNRPKYFATKLWNIMKSTGINDNTVMMRIIISRCEIDMKQILNEFDSLNGKSLKECLELQCKQLEDEDEIRISKSNNPCDARFYCDKTPIQYRRLLLRLIGA
ncbi:unnamed protein product [Schistosoma turkestanicum]|nr:unnamed protein product [Schistosoma turkestanicum]